LQLIVAIEVAELDRRRDRRLSDDGECADRRQRIQKLQGHDLAPPKSIGR